MLAYQITANTHQVMNVVVRYVGLREMESHTALARQAATNVTQITRGIVVEEIV